MNRQRHTTRREQPNNGNRSGASRGGFHPIAWLRNYLIRHLQTFFYALGQLTRHPFSSLMTTAVIGIALAMPAGLHVLMGNVQQVVSGWDGAAQISLFLKHGVSEKRAIQLARSLEQQGSIASVDYISSDQAMEEFRRLSGFGDALNALTENPLPKVLVVHPAVVSQGADRVEKLLLELRIKPDVDLAQLDLQWVKRLYGIMAIGQRAVWVLAGLLALAVLLVVGNTIRLAIQNRRDEIVVMKLIGGTDAFIRRPFLYTGFWYGVFGSLIALFLVEGALALLKGPVQNLAGLYNSEFALVSLDPLTMLVLLGFGTLLGLSGSWLAVGRHLNEIEPT